MHRSTSAGAVLLAASLGCSGGPTEPTTEAPSDKAGPQATESSELHVEVFYRERMLLPRTATLEVVLEDNAKMDVAAELVTKKSVALEGAPPPFRLILEYDPAGLDRRGRYGVRARIEDEERLLFTSTTFCPAFGAEGSIDAPPNDPVLVLVSRVAGSQPPTGRSITGTRWVFEKLRGEDAGVGAGGKAPFIVLQGAEPRISGFAGCNQFTGAYELKERELSFSKMAMTLRACLEGMELEREVAKVLAETRSYEVSGDVLRLHDESGAVLAELKAE